jgi:hypothetical protein
MPRKPTQAEAPAECAFRDCDRRPTETVRFRDPPEYVCYCSDHAGVVNTYAGAKYRSRLRS